MPRQVTREDSASSTTPKWNTQRKHALNVMDQPWTERKSASTIQSRKELTPQPPVSKLKHPQRLLTNLRCLHSSFKVFTWEVAVLENVIDQTAADDHHVIAAIIQGHVLDHVLAAVNRIDNSPIPRMLFLTFHH
jgi:hypothetical protein